MLPLKKQGDCMPKGETIEPQLATTLDRRLKKLFYYFTECYKLALTKILFKGVQNVSIKR